MKNSQTENYEKLILDLASVFRQGSETTEDSIVMMTEIPNELYERLHDAAKSIKSDKIKNG